MEHDLWDLSFINRCVWGRGEGFFQGEGQEKYCCVRGEGGHYMKNKNIGRFVLSTQSDQQKRPQCRNAQKMQKKKNK